MRVRFMSENEQILRDCPRVENDPQSFRGRWHERFDGPVCLEIGCGLGGFLAATAAQRPEENFIGLERIGTVLAKAVMRIPQDQVLPNLVFMRGEARDLLECFADGEVDRIYLNFSDPWPKKHHAKRRLTSDRFLPIYERILAPGGRIRMKTDNDQLYAFSLESFAARHWEIIETSTDLHHSAFLPDNVMTEYERKFAQQGKNINYILAQAPKK